MKKLSAVSIASSFTKRSGSFVSAKQAPAEEDAVEEDLSDSDEHGLMMSRATKDKRDAATVSAPSLSGGGQEHAALPKLPSIDYGQEIEKETTVKDKKCDTEDERNEIETGTVRRLYPRPELAIDTQTPTIRGATTSTDGIIPADQNGGLALGGEMKKVPSLPAEKTATKIRSTVNKPSTPTKTTDPSGKENCRVGKALAKPGIVRRASSKWKVPKTIVLNKGVVSQGIRSIFK
jgi:hypothetical protein